MVLFKTLNVMVIPAEKKKKHKCFVCGTPGIYVNLGQYECVKCDVSWKET